MDKATPQWQGRMIIVKQDDRLKYQGSKATTSKKMFSKQSDRGKAGREKQTSIKGAKQIDRGKPYIGNKHCQMQPLT